MPNSDRLEGMKCPNCGSEEPFIVGADVTVEVFNSGASDHCDNELCPNTPRICKACNFIGIVRNFTAKNQGGKWRHDLRPFTVVIVDPSGGGDDLWENSSVQHVMAPNQIEAGRRARTQRAAAILDGEENEALKRQEQRRYFEAYKTISVFPGHLKDIFGHYEYRDKVHFVNRTMVPPEMEEVILCEALEKLMPEHEVNMCYGNSWLPCDTNIPKDIWDAAVQEVLSDETAETSE